MTINADQRPAAVGPEFQVKVHGDSPAELEQAACDAAVAFFGSSAVLEAVRNYCARPSLGGDDTDKPFAAIIHVRAVEADPQ